MVEQFMTLLPILIPVAWFVFRLEKHIANDSRVEAKLDKILEELIRGNK